MTVEVLAIFDGGEVETQGAYRADDGVLSCDTCSHTSFTSGKQEWIDAAIDKYETQYGGMAA
mgnify:CR=1 FL=1